MNCGSCGRPIAEPFHFCPQCGAARGAVAVAQPAVVFRSSNEKTAAALCHISALSGYFIPFGNLIGPLIVWLLKRDESLQVDREGKKSLNFQISITLYAIVTMLFMFPLVVFPPLMLLVAIPVMVMVGLGDAIATIAAAIAVANGEPSRYPLAIPFLR